MRRPIHIVSLAGAWAAALAVLACGAVARPAPTPAAAVSPRDGLHARPLQLPPVPAGSPCPASPQVGVPAPPSTVTGKSAVPGYAFGKGPAYLSGQISWYAGAPGQVAMIVFDATYTGPVLVRVRRLDGDGRATLTNLPVAGIVPMAGQLADGTVTADGVELTVPQPSTPGLWGAWSGRLTADPPGCYALQIDGSSFTSVIVFGVRPGPLPPG
jgi:hypothetical protein